MTERWIVHTFRSSSSVMGFLSILKIINEKGAWPCQHCRGNIEVKLPCRSRQHNFYYEKRLATFCYQISAKDQYEYSCASHAENADYGRSQPTTRDQATLVYSKDPHPETSLPTATCGNTTRIDAYSEFEQETLLRIVLYRESASCSEAA